MDLEKRHTAAKEAFNTLQEAIGRRYQLPAAILRTVEAAKVGLARLRGEYGLAGFDVTDSSRKTLQKTLEQDLTAQSLAWSKNLDNTLILLDKASEHLITGARVEVAAIRGELAEDLRRLTTRSPDAPATEQHCRQSTQPGERR